MTEPDHRDEPARPGDPAGPDRPGDDAAAPRPADPAADPAAPPAPGGGLPRVLIAALAVVLVLGAGVAGWRHFAGGPEGHGAPLTAEAVRDRLPAPLAGAWVAQACVAQPGTPPGLGLDGDVEAMNCLLLDTGAGEPADGPLVAMYSDPGVAEAVRGDADLVDLGEAGGGAHRMRYQPGTGFSWDLREDAVLRFGPHADEDAARAFAAEAGLVEEG
ncbi:hypothetical protein [Corynebacterium sphenisci]|uniref:hypothetical protein n=1 Tax=Corynebacterium sphenisci TaxID=191493 RepID=UPI0026E0C80B|nr:hypothetical protein [Corynebacterium sphenisci]MDO5731329.1 hypothetical protein [Corynebacterium sphenisci]